MCEICSKLTIKTSEPLYWHRSSVFVVNLELVNFSCSCVSTVNFEQGSVPWDVNFKTFGDVTSVDSLMWVDSDKP